MNFPIEIWRQIKNYMLGQKYWKEKMKLCFYNSKQRVWVSGHPTLCFKGGIISYHCSLSIQGIHIPTTFINNKRLDKYKKTGRKFGNMERYEVITVLE